MNTMNINEYEKVTAIISLTKRNGEILAFKELGDKCLSLQPLPDAILEYTNKVTMGVVKPKYDPCRLFRKGDEVEYRPKDGRANPNLLVGRRYKVAADEPCDSGIVQVEFDGLRHIDTFVAYNNLELVTPVEELEPYTVVESYGRTDVMKGDYIIATYTDSHPHAKEAAEAERDRLNAEYRKEQEK